MSVSDYQSIMKSLLELLSSRDQVLKLTEVYEQLAEKFKLTEIYRAKLLPIYLETPGSISRDKRGALSISQFMKISELVWGEK